MVAAATEHSFEDDFKALDLNSDGMIDAQELLIAYAGQLSEYQKMDVFGRDVDKNQDGVLSWQEYVDFSSSL